MILKKAASQDKKKKEKKGEEDQSFTNGIGLDRKMFGSRDMIHNVTCSDTDA